MIVKNGGQITSPKELANNLNENFNTNIKEKRAKIPKAKEDPIELLQRMIPQNKN